MKSEKLCTVLLTIHKFFWHLNTICWIQNSQQQQEHVINKNNNNRINDI